MDERLKVALEILKKEGKLRSNELVRRLKDEGKMSRQTAINTIEEGVSKRKIFREDVIVKEKEQAVYYTVYPDITKNEKILFEQMNKFLKDFDDRFSIFKEKFSRMSIEGKSQGVEGFSLFLIHFNLAVRRLWESHEKKREWKTLQNLVHSRMGSLNKLLKSRPKKEQNVIGRHVLEGELLYLDEAKGFLDEYLQKIK